MTSKEKLCRICKENLLTKFGTCVASISLFVGTSNKEFKSVLGGKPVVLGDLLNRIGLFAAPSDQNSVCKKCARKVVNCYKLYQELQVVFARSSEEMPDNVPRTPEKTARKTKPQNIDNIIHERSPTGLTPSTKRQKPFENEAKSQHTTSPQSRKSLFKKDDITEENSSEPELSTAHDTIRNLMNIPTNICGVTNNLPPIVKVLSLKLLLLTIRSIRL